MTTRVFNEDLAAWIIRQSDACDTAMARAISATHLTRSRPAFGQIVAPVAGSTLASPVIADWDPEPDYFFHWIRDSAIVMRAVVERLQDAASDGERRRGQRLFDDFVRFSLTLSQLDGADTFSRGDRTAVRPEALPFVRPDAEIRALAGDNLLGEPRFNPDGSIDIQRWSRPQYDGPALRALTCLRFLAGGGARTDELAALLRQDLDFTLRHAGERCIGPWEVEGQDTHHYYVALVQRGALTHGQDWAVDPDAWRAAQARLCATLDRHWSQKHQVYAATWPLPADPADDLIDSAILLGVLDADLPEGPHSAWDPRVHATQGAIESLFKRKFPLNQGGPADKAPVLGRFNRDDYFGGGAWYVTTLAAAALYYRRALGPGGNRAALLARGDAFMARVREFIPEDGSMSEQIDVVSGAPTSARHLTWSYAAFLSAAHLRARAAR